MIEKSLARRLPDTRAKTEIVIPVWLQDYATAWAEQGAQAVVLFGSRGLGFALPDSDWDVAVVFDRVQRPILPNLLTVKVEANIETRQEINEVVRHLDKLSYSFAREIAQGVSLVGDFAGLINPPNANVAKSQNKRELKNHLVHTFINALDCLAVVSLKWGISKTPLNQILSETATSSSAYSAERCVKALCCLFELKYRFTHNVAELATTLPKEWYDIVIRMNGTTHRGHAAVYELDFDAEDGETCVQRIQYTLDLTDLILCDERANLSDDDLNEIRTRVIEDDGIRNLHFLSKRGTHRGCADLALEVLMQLDRTGGLAKEWGLGREKH